MPAATQSELLLVLQKCLPAGTPLVTHLHFGTVHQPAGQLRYGGQNKSHIFRAAFAETTQGDEILPADCQVASGRKLRRSGRTGSREIHKLKKVIARRYAAMVCVIYRSCGDSNSAAQNFLGRSQESRIRNAIRVSEYQVLTAHVIYADISRGGCIKSFATADKPRDAAVLGDLHDCRIMPAVHHQDFKG
jgi:hypothetical protein